MASHQTGERRLVALVDKAMEQLAIREISIVMFRRDLVDGSQDR